MVTEQEVRAAAAEIYKPEGVDIWMAAPNKSLGGFRPVSVVRAGEGQMVLSLLEGMAAGAMG